MSVFIKGMEKPEHCGYCRFRYDGICHALQKTQYSMNECPLVGIDEAGLNDTIEELEADRKNGVWIEENSRPRSSQFYCSICHRTAYDPQPTRAKGWVKRCRYAFCPNCGADMRGSDD